MTTTDEDRKLLALLRANARASTASIARKLGLSRTTVQERIARLERTGAIAGYTLREPDGRSSALSALVLLNVDAKVSETVVRELKSMPTVSALRAVSGVFDYVATVEADTTAELDRELDRIGRLDGIARTQTLVVLSTRFER
ncbi:MAG TPA: Lrp/AsnC family transcriptional regulator [Casimicrobiaceae bacterium]|jgi:DNA-binding Lrp family transcriptional regulator|nr:Lrp/AsnC family transcriptional regulator [Casimicrobiaceae bacterium]